MIQEDVRLREDVAGPANRAATGVLALVAALTALSAAGGGASAAANDVARISQATQASAGASRAAASASADNAAAAKVSIAAMKQESDALKLAQKSADQQNAAMSRVIQAQVQRDAKLELEAQKSAAKLVQIEAKKQADLEKIQVREAKRAEALARELPRRDQGVRDRLDGILGKLGGGVDMSAMGGQVGDLAEKFKSLGTAEGMASAALGASVAVIGAAVGYLTMLGGALASVAKMSMEASDARASLIGQLSALTGSTEAAGRLAQSIDQVAKVVPVGKDRLADFARAAAAAGLQGDKLTGTMEALARVESVAGAEGANRIAEFVGKVGTAGKMLVPEAEALKGTGVTIDALYTQIAERMGVGKDKVEALLKAGKVTAEEGIDALNAAIAAKLGKGAAAAMLRFDVQILKAKESLAGMLAGVDWSPLQKGLATVLSAFDDSTASGQKLKALTQDFFGTMGALAARAAPYVKAFLEGMIDGVSSMWEGMKAALPTIEKLLGISPDGTDTEKWRQFGETVAKLAFYAAGAAAGILAVVGAVVGFAAWIGSVIAGVGDAADGVGAKFSWLGSIAKVVLSPVVGAVGIVIDVFKALGSALDWVIGKFNALRGASSTSVQMPTVTGSTAAAGGAANDNGGGATSGGGAVGDAIASPRSGAAAPAAGGRSVVFNVSAPVTISVPPGGNAAQAGRDAADGFWLRVRELAEVAA